MTMEEFLRKIHPAKAPPPCAASRRALILGAVIGACSAFLLLEASSALRGRDAARSAVEAFQGALEDEASSMDPQGQAILALAASRASRAALISVSGMDKPVR